MAPPRWCSSSRIPTRRARSRHPSPGDHRPSRPPPPRPRLPVVPTVQTAVVAAVVEMAARRGGSRWLRCSLLGRCSEAAAGRAARPRRPRAWGPQWWWGRARATGKQPSTSQLFVLYLLLLNWLSGFQQPRSPAHHPSLSLFHRFIFLVRTKKCNFLMYLFLCCVIVRCVAAAAAAAAAAVVVDDDAA